MESSFGRAIFPVWQLLWIWLTVLNENKIAMVQYTHNLWFVVIRERLNSELGFWNKWKIWGYNSHFIFKQISTTYPWTWRRLSTFSQITIYFSECFLQYSHVEYVVSCATLFLKPAWVLLIVSYIIFIFSNILFALLLRDVVLYLEPR
jgi:hypothetical protein